MITNLVFAYLLIGLVVLLATQVAVARRGGSQPSTKGLRPAPGQIRWGTTQLMALIAWPIELARWPRTVDRLVELSDAAPRRLLTERTYSEEEYEAAERRSDRMVMLWFVVIAASAGLAGLLTAATGWDAGWCTLLVMGTSVVGFLWWASRGNAELPPTRPRPLRPMWIAKMMGFLLGLCLVALVLVAIVGSIA